MERAGAIAGMDRWTERKCRQCRQWRERLPLDFGREPAPWF
jgi:hypothetical protein